MDAAIPSLSQRRSVRVGSSLGGRGSLVTNRLRRSPAGEGDEESGGKRRCRTGLRTERVPSSSGSVGISDRINLAKPLDFPPALGRSRLSCPDRSCRGRFSRAAIDDDSFFYSLRSFLVPDSQGLAGRGRRIAAPTDPLRRTLWRGRCRGGTAIRLGSGKRVSPGDLLPGHPSRPPTLSCPDLRRRVR